MSGEAMKNREPVELLISLLALTHGNALVDAVWYPRSRRIEARLQDGSSAIYDAKGEWLGPGPVLGERGISFVPPSA